MNYMTSMYLVHDTCKAGNIVDCVVRNNKEIMVCTGCKRTRAVTNRLNLYAKRVKARYGGIGLVVKF